MLKQSLIYLILSCLVLTFSKYAHVLFIYIDILYTKIYLALTPLFSTSYAGILLSKIVTLTLIPICITAVPALIYRAIKGKLIPYYFEATWLIWLVIVISKIIIT